MRDGRTASSVSEQSCVAPKSNSIFQPVDRQTFVWFVALQVRAGDQLRVEWLDPSGTVSTTADYGELPNCGRVVLHRATSHCGIRARVAAWQLDGTRGGEWRRGVFAEFHHRGRHR